MPPDEPITNAELARRFDDRVGDLRDDLHEIKGQIDKLVPREVWDVQRTALDGRLTSLEKQVASLEEQRRQANRWVISAIVVPVLVLVIQFFLSSRGVKP